MLLLYQQGGGGGGGGGRGGQQSEEEFSRDCYPGEVSSSWFKTDSIYKNTGNGIPHDKCNLHGIAHARTNKKDDIFMQRQLVQSFTCILEGGARDLYIDEAHMALDIFRFAAFFMPKLSCGILVANLEKKFLLIC